MPWLLIFSLAVTLIFGYVQVYEKKLYLEERSEQLAQLELELGELKKQRQQMEQNIEARASALGLYKPSTEDMIVLHIRAATQDH